MNKLEELEQKEDWKKNVWFYEKHKNRIREHYGSREFIVMEKQKIIDSGINQFSLARQYQHRNVLIISPHFSNIIHKIPSPEMI